MKKAVKFFEIKDLSDLPNKPVEEKIVLCDQLSSVEVLSLCISANTNHVVQKSNIQTDTELELSSNTLEKPELFTKFPLSTILGVENPSEKTENEKADLSFQITEPKDKEIFLDKLESYLSQICKRSSILADIKIAVDELISNSLFNAPYVDKDNSEANVVDRDYTKIVIEKDKQPLVFAGCDKNRIIVGCTDYYGRLNVKKLIERIKLCYINNPGKMIRFDSGGAGIGSFMIFDSCISYYVSVIPGKATTVCCSFPVNMSSKQRAEIPKNVHIIMHRETDGP